MAERKPQNAVIAIRLANEFGCDIHEEKLVKFAKENGYKGAVLIKNYKEYCKLLNIFKSI